MLQVSVNGDVRWGKVGSGAVFGTSQQERHPHYSYGTSFKVPGKGTLPGGKMAVTYPHFSLCLFPGLKLLGAALFGGNEDDFVP
jgi:hypothetical protein